MRLYIISKKHTIIDYLDNEYVDKRFWDDSIHEYLTGTISTFSFTTLSKNSSSIVPGHHISFKYNDKYYYFTIVKVNESEKIKTVECYSLNLDFTNEIANVINRGIPDEELYSKDIYKKGIVWYIQQSLDRNYDQSFIRLPNAQNGLTNEISKVTKALRFDNTSDTMMSRLYDLADLFDAELYISTSINDKGELKHIDINIFHEHDDKHQGIGTKRTDVKCVYGNNVSGVNRNIDITELYTAIRPYAETDDGIITLEGAQLYVYTDGSRSINKDPSKTVEYYTTLGDKNIYAPISSNTYPSGTGNNYIVKKEFTNISNRNKLFEYALKELKKNSKPKIDYDINTIDIDVNIGDTVVVQDQEFDQELYIECRVIEKTFSLTNIRNKEYVFSNYKEIKSEIPKRILELDELSKKIYSGHISGSGWQEGDPGYEHQDSLRPGFATWYYVSSEIPWGEYRNQSKLLVTLDDKSENDITLNGIINGMRFDISMGIYSFYALTGVATGYQYKPLNPQIRIGNYSFNLYYLNYENELLPFILNNYYIKNIVSLREYKSPEKIILSLQYMHDRMIINSIKLSFTSQRELNILNEEVSTLPETIYNIIYPIGITVLFTKKQESFPYGRWELMPQDYYPVSWNDDIPVGSETISAGLPNITGSIDGVNMRGSSANNITKHDAFIDSYRRTGSAIGCGTPYGDVISELKFNANDSNSIYGNSNTVRPQSRKYHFYTRIA